MGGLAGLGTTGLVGSCQTSDGCHVVALHIAFGGSGPAGCFPPHLRRGCPRVSDGVGVVARCPAKPELAGAAHRWITLFPLGKLSECPGSAGITVFQLGCPREFSGRYLSFRIRLGLCSSWLAGWPIASSERRRYTQPARTLKAIRENLPSAEKRERQATIRSVLQGPVSGLPAVPSSRSPRQSIKGTSEL